MKTLLRNTAFGLVGAAAVAMMVATVVESAAGADAASNHIYRAPWMIALWAVAAASGALYLLIRRRSLSVPAAGLHAALLLILAGALTTFLFGRQGRITLETSGEPVAAFSADDGGHIELPFTLRLDSAYILYYPGTTAAMDYVSELTVERAGHPAERRRLSMNKIADIDGYRLYQTAIGHDYSVLSVSHDPWGIGITYGGYALLFLSMGAFFFSRKSRWAQLLRRGAATVLLLIGPSMLGGSEAKAAPPTIDASLARHFGKVNVYWGDRIMPLQTMARDFCLKVYGKESYQGLSAEQVLAGWLFYYDQWKNEPFIRLEGHARELIGVDGRHASLRQFYNSRGYLLEDAVANDITDLKLRQTDERVALVTMVCTGKALRWLPVLPAGAGGSGRVEWLSPVDHMPVEMTDSDYSFCATLLDRLGRDIATRQWRDAYDRLQLLAAYQAKVDAVAPVAVLPSPARVEAELLYNRWGSPLWAALATAFCLLLMLSRKAPQWLAAGATWAVWLWATAILALRGYIGGHLPMSNGFETMLTMGWIALLMGALGATFRRTQLAMAALLTAFLALMVALMGRSGATVSLLMPVLASPLLSLHVLLVMGAYALLAIIAILSAAALRSPHSGSRTGRGCRERKGKADRQEEGTCEKLADKEKDASRGDATIILLLYPAVFLLAAGIFVGAIWANQSWGRYWGWDPKETWALITLLIYAMPLHSASFAWLRRPRTLHLYLLLAFLSVLFTYFGVNYLLTGLHSYA